MSKHEAHGVFKPPLKPYSLASWALRAVFEPRLLGPTGFHASAAQCAADWDYVVTTPAFIEQIERAIAWLALWPRTKAITRGSNSYGLKHEAEDWHRARGEYCNCYVSNGALIMAAIRLGFMVKRDPYRLDYPNAWFNISRRRSGGGDDAPPRPSAGARARRCLYAPTWPEDAR